GDISLMRAGKNHLVPTKNAPLSFLSCWIAAVNHLNKHLEGGIDFSYLAHPYAPFLEHLTFRVGNQLFFVRVEDVDGTVRGPGTIEGLNYVARLANGVACILPMRNQSEGGAWKAS